MRFAGGVGKQMFDSFDQIGEIERLIEKCLDFEPTQFGMVGVIVGWDHHKLDARDQLQHGAAKRADRSGVFKIGIEDGQVEKGFMAARDRIGGAARDFDLVPAHFFQTLADQFPKCGEWCSYQDLRGHIYESIMDSGQWVVNSGEEIREFGV